MKSTSDAPAATGYHDVHLPEDPARAMVWAVIAEYLRPWVRPGAVLEIGAGHCCWINSVQAARRSPWLGRYAAHAAASRAVSSMRQPV
jgi:hypothetical protein